MFSYLCSIVPRTELDARIQRFRYAKNVGVSIGIDSFDGSSYLQTALRGNEFLIASGRELRKYKAVAIGQKIVAPTCYCPVCLRLTREGFDPRTTGTRQANLGRVAHNLGQTLIAQFTAG